VFFSGSPRNEAGPVTEKSAPILIGAAASAEAALHRSIRKQTTAKILFIDKPPIIRVNNYLILRNK
jgi:hypothetical protein